MKLVIDDGNTRTKAGTFNDGGEITVQAFDSDQGLTKFIQSHAFRSVIVSSVRGRASEILSWIPSTARKIELNSNTSLPFRVGYETPQTLGVDRLAAAAGAIDLFAGRNCLVIDAGTCITYEFISDDRVYQGGAISPGVRMRFEAMHKFTARLPLVDIVDHPKLVGRTTEQCLQSGVINGIAEEIRGIVARYRTEADDLQVILCGGDAPLFENIDKPSIFVAPNLVLHGLRAILTHNVAE